MPTVNQTGQIATPATTDAILVQQVNGVTGYETPAQIISTLRNVANGVAGTDASNNISAQTVLATGATTARALAAMAADALTPAAFKLSTDADDTNSLNAAAAYSAAHGVPIFLEGKTYTISSPFLLPAGAVVIGAGRDICTIFLANGADCSVVTGNTGYTLFGTTTINGDNNVVLTDCTINGNSANQTSVTPDQQNGIGLYGAHPVFERLYICNVIGHGIRTQYAGVPAANSGEEGVFRDLRVYNAGRHGWWNAGPTDSWASDWLIQDAGQSADNTYCGVYLDTNSGMRAINIHSYHSSVTNKVQFGISTNGGSQLTACLFEGGRASVQTRSGLTDAFVNCDFFAPTGVSGSAVVHLEGNFGIFSGCNFGGVTGSSPYYYAVQFGASGRPVTGNIFIGCFFGGFYNGPFNFVNSSGYNRVSGTGYVGTSGGSTTTTGTYNSTDSIDYAQTGATAWGVHYSAFAETYNSLVTFNSGLTSAGPITANGGITGSGNMRLTGYVQMQGAPMSAAGTTAGTATVISNQYSIVTAGTGGVALPAIYLTPFTIYNESGSTITVYSAAGATVGTIANNTLAKYYAYNSTTILPA